MNYPASFVSIAAALLLTGASPAPSPENLASLQGTWEMVSAYEIKADGTRTTNYGEHPLGLLTVDAAHRYNMQIFKVGRSAFASGDKARGTPDEYRQAVVGSSTHFGVVTIDRAKHELVFDVKAASFPNWEGKRQVRDYTFKDGLLSYAVPASASSSGIVAYSIWRRITP
ncbi:Lipocalin-like domain-containing protein [Sphingomonas antarctica]|uniref:lipocalin-like domain-containing protein n=1 Tax=Sphingomonas antarctica TaxID=2040274 RepID=UPI0039E9BDAE